LGSRISLGKRVREKSRKKKDLVIEVPELQALLRISED
jgi:glutamine phosphoribosylpyrophosphate amidotransferase